MKHFIRQTARDIYISTDTATYMYIYIYTYTPAPQPSTPPPHPLTVCLLVCLCVLLAPFVDILMPCPLVCLSAQRTHTHPLQTHTLTHTHPPCLALFVLQSNVASRRRSGSTACLAFVIGCHWWPRCGFIFLLISSFPGCSLSSAPGTGASALHCAKCSIAGVPKCCCCCCHCCCCCCRLLQTYERTPPTYFVSKAICLFIVEVFIVVVPLLACSSGHSWGHFNCRAPGKQPGDCAATGNVSSRNVMANRRNWLQLSKTVTHVSLYLHLQSKLI